MTITLIWVIFLYWALVNSIKKPADTFGYSWIPFVQFQPTLEHYAGAAIPETRQAAQQHGHFGGRSNAGNLLSVFVAYGIARFRFVRPGNGTLTTWFLSQRIMPPVVVLIPYFR